MERSRHRKSKSFSGIEGIRLSYRQKSVSRLSSDSRAYIDESTKEDMFVLDFGKSPLRRHRETSMKKLLAEEMSKEFELKKQRASVLGRLMGLEGSASPKHANRQQKSTSGSYHHQQNFLVGRQRSREPYDSHSNRSRSSVDHHDFKDVYEDLEASHLENRRSSRWNASSMLTEAEMTPIQQKFIDAKLLSTNKKLQDSIELDDALDSNRDLLTRFLQEPKNMHDHCNSSSGGSQIAVLRPSSTKYRSNSKAQNLQQNTYLKRKDSLLLEPQKLRGTYVSRKKSNIPLVEKNKERTLPTRIVILKPNNMRNGRLPGLSPDQGLGFSEMRSFRERDMSRNVGLSRPMSVEAREIARRIARRMRDSYDETFDTKSTILRGYAGDESSYSESDSDYETEKLKLSHHKSFGNLKVHRYPSPQVGESSVNKEGKQRLSERWKMTQRYQDLEIVSKGSTLGEMLSLHDHEVRPKQLSDKTSGDNGSGIGYDPYGISSRDGWKDETSRTSTRSRSVPPSIRGKSHKKSTHHNGSIENKPLFCSDHNHSGRVKIVKRKLSHGGDFSSKDSTSRSKTPFPYQHSFNNRKESISEAFEIEMEANIKELPERKVTFQIAEEDDTSRSPVSDLQVIAEHGSKILSSKSHENLLEELPLIANEDTIISHDAGNSSLQEPNEELSEQTSPFKSGVEGEPDSSRKPKEANRNSPDSVLEVPFKEDASSCSEGFERLGAELHELRMKLQLLKMESGTYTEASSSLVPTEEEALAGLNEYNLSVVQDWEISYTLDILQESGLEDSIFDTFKSKWHSSDCPLDFKLFDDLENKYNDETTGLSSERKLLFDRTNFAISEIWQENVDLFPWVKPKLTWYSSISSNEGVGVVLEKLMRDEDPNAVLSGELDKEMQWSDCKEEIDAIGNDVEKMLVDEMIVEFFM